MKKPSVNTGRTKSPTASAKNKVSTKTSSSSQRTTTVSKSATRGPVKTK